MGECLRVSFLYFQKPLGHFVECQNNIAAWLCDANKSSHIITLAKVRVNNAPAALQTIRPK